MDILNIHEYLEEIIPTLPSGLVVSPYLGYLQRAASLFPGTPARCAVFECRLEPANAQIDCLFIHTRADRNLLVERNAHLDMEAFASVHPVWKRILDFYRAWAQPGSPLYFKCTYCNSRI